jgi:hypothetical protein
MSYRLVKPTILLALAALLIAPISSSARTPLYPVPLCQAVEQLPDGSWSTKFALRFGRAGEVGAGATLYQGEVINGVDLGAVLERNCSVHLVERPVYFCYTWFYCAYMPGS